MVQHSIFLSGLSIIIFLTFKGNANLAGSYDVYVCCVEMGCGWNSVDL